MSQFLKQNHLQFPQTEQIDCSWGSSPHYYTLSTKNRSQQENYNLSHNQITIISTTFMPKTELLNAIFTFIEKELKKIRISIEFEKDREGEENSLVLKIALKKHSNQFDLFEQYLKGFLLEALDCNQLVFKIVEGLFSLQDKEYVRELLYLVAQIFYDFCFYSRMTMPTKDLLQKAKLSGKNIGNNTIQTGKIQYLLPDEDDFSSIVSRDKCFQEFVSRLTIQLWRNFLHLNKQLSQKFTKSQQVFLEKPKLSAPPKLQHSKENFQIFHDRSELADSSEQEEEINFSYSKQMVKSQGNFTIQRKGTGLTRQSMKEGVNIDFSMTDGFPLAGSKNSEDTGFLGMDFLSSNYQMESEGSRKGSGMSFQFEDYFS